MSFQQIQTPKSATKKEKDNFSNNNLKKQEYNQSFISKADSMDFNFLDNKPIIQTKLKVSQPGDEYEREADRVAEQVMRMSPIPEKSHLSMKNSNDNDYDDKKLNRKCTSCEEEEENEELQNIKINRNKNHIAFIALHIFQVFNKKGFLFSRIKKTFRSTLFFSL